MFSKILKKLFRSKSKRIARSDSGEGASETAATKGRRGRKLTELAVKAHDHVAAALSDEPKTRGKILAALADESERAYADTNWQNVIARLVAEGRAKLASESRRGRSVSYQKAS